YKLIILFVFFFQAEDGIRDDLVTGVQTCALPIFATSIREVWIDVRDESLRATRVVDRLLILTCVSLAATIALTIVVVQALIATRSEERRVGKEWRNRSGG